ncbi:MAG: hypothetical protein HYR98_07530 [Nitrospirae bacterium]|nr:hypothetical protein [Nitrospirota bacterium]
MSRDARPRTLRIPFLALGMLSLALAVWGGLARLGLDVPAAPRLALFHGPLMISGFLGTVIGLERAVALKRTWTYAVPLLSGLGALALVFGLPERAGAALIVLASLGLVGIFTVIVRIQPALHSVIMGVAAGCWLVGNVLWLLGQPVHLVVHWWGAYLVLTIAGERLELSRLLEPPPSAKAAFQAFVGVYLAGVALTGAFPDAGARIAGAGMVLVTFWLFFNDIARRTIRNTGLTRFTAVCLLSGYVWLGVSGFLLLAGGHVPAGPVYDAVLHALFLGFVFAMIFGHAPIIFPAVLGLPVFFRSVFYVHLAVLHASLVLRVAGDLSSWSEGRAWGGALNGLAILLFIASTVYAILRPPSPLSAGG